ncbi:MAG: FAD-binding oxidoreductase [Chloroflexota bacterium]|nr:FAD-binding oxidoreductase [Chloroflexota bacterium]
MEEPIAVTQADAVVIGAGAFGLSVGYQLAAHGAGTVVVLDRFAPGTQTSPRAAGLYKVVQADETLTRLARLSIEVIRGFSDATGVPLSYVQSGSLLAARTPEHTAIVEEEAAAALGWGVELERVDANDVHRLAPYVTGRGIRSAYFIPEDIYIEEPRSLLEAYITAIAQLGSHVVGEAPVTGITVDDGEIAGVSTPRGDIATPLVIDAAGAWARGVGALAGVDVPVAPVRHQLMITRPIAGMNPAEPIARIVDASAYLRPARGGLMMGGMECDPIAIDPRRDPSFTMADTPLDMSVLDGFTESLGSLVPALGDTPVAEHRGGLFTMTPDARFLAGPIPGVRGLWTATGCNGSGFSISAGIGRALAEWIVGGEPPFDLSRLDPGRFGPGPFDDDGLTAAGLWRYANYYTPQPVGEGRESATGVWA